MPLCEGCGASYEDTFKFCPQCGRAKPEPKKVTIEVEVKGKAHDFDCPLCGDASAIQKVSAIVDGHTNISQGSTSGSGTSRVYSERTGEQVGSAYTSSTTNTIQKSQSSLAQKLTLPPAPVKPQWSNFAMSTKALTAVFCSLYVIGLFITRPVEDLFELGSYWKGAMVFFCLAPLLAIIGSFAVMRLVEKLTGSKAKYQAALAQYQEDARIYEKLFAQWEELFYCHKHDVVYTLSRREAVPVSEAISSCIRWGMSSEKN